LNKTISVNIQTDQIYTHVEGKAALRKASYYYRTIFSSIHILFIDRWLNDIVQIVSSRLKNKYATHSVFSTSSKQFTFWRNNNINDNFWNPKDTNQIISILEETIFSELGIHQLYQLLITLDVPAKYIDYVSYFKLHYIKLIDYVLF